MLFLKLVLAHFLCDYPLQGDFLAKGKNHKNPLPGVPWWQCLVAHAFIQAAGVYVVTHNLCLAIGEFGLHFWIDFNKSDGSFSYNTDQALHIACKVLYFFSA